MTLLEWCLAPGVPKSLAAVHKAEDAAISRNFPDLSLHLRCQSFPPCPYLLCFEILCICSSRSLLCFWILTHSSVLLLALWLPVLLGLWHGENQQETGIRKEWGWGLSLWRHSSKGHRPLHPALSSPKFCKGSLLLPLWAHQGNDAPWLLTQRHCTNLSWDFLCFSYTLLGPL